MTCPTPPAVRRVVVDGAEEARTHDALCRAGETELARLYQSQLARARALLLGRLLAALWREDVAGLRQRARAEGPPAQPVRRSADPPDGRWMRADLPGGAGWLEFPVRAEHAFARLEPGAPVRHRADGGQHTLDHPTELVAVLAHADPGPGWSALATEVADATANLALARARAERSATELRQEAAAAGASDCLELAGHRAAQGLESTVLLEQLSTDGHNLHPCARTRLGMSTEDLLSHDLEAAGPTRLTLVGVRRDHVLSTPDDAGVDVGELLLGAYPHLVEAIAQVGLERSEYLFVPVHDWQLRNVVATRYRPQIERGMVVPVPAATLLAEATMALRTLLTEPGPDGRRFFVKTALDIQVTSTRRTISGPTTANGAAFSRLLGRIAAGEPELLGRSVMLEELAGASFVEDGVVARDLAALVRSGPDVLARDGEVVVPGCALYATSPLSGRTVLAELVDRHPLGPEAFLTEYAGLLLRPVITLMTAYGVGLEAHLQNVLPVFAGGVPIRMAFRDWGGMRVHLPRLARSGHTVAVRSGSVTVTDRIETTWAKVAYTALQNHLGELVMRLGESHGLAEPLAWRQVRGVLREVFAELRSREALRDAVDADEAALLAPTLPYKALVTMRLAALGGTRTIDAGSDDRYLAVPSPLASGP